MLVNSEDRDQTPYYAYVPKKGTMLIWANRLLRYIKKTSAAYKLWTSVNDGNEETYAQRGHTFIVYKT